MSGRVSHPTDGAAGSGNGRTPPAANRMIMLIRHAEKPLHPSGSPRGVSPEGQQDPHSLTVTGWIRAGALVELFAPSRGEPFADLRRPDTIYGSAYVGAHSKRSVQTVSPLAARLGLVVITRFAVGDEISLVREISSRPGATLVAWHHETIHEIAHGLGQVDPTPPDHWPHDRFDMIWTFTPGQQGWRFTQIPQLLLPGDLPYPIEPTPRTPS
jgi:broad specificity phosphatase PhoE